MISSEMISNRHVLHELLEPSLSMTSDRSSFQEQAQPPVRLYVFRLDYPSNFPDTCMEPGPTGEVNLETGELSCHVLKGQPQNSWKISTAESINLVRCSSPARMQSPLCDPWQRVPILTMLESTLNQHILRRCPVP